MLHKYEIEVNNSKQLKDNIMLNCSMVNNLFRENLITEEEHIQTFINSIYFLSKI